MTIVEHEPNPVAVSDEQRNKLLELVREKPGIGIAHAMRDVGIAGTKGQLRQYVADHPDLADDIHEARGAKLRDELMSRAIDGFEEPIVSVKGEIVGYRTVRSDRLLEFACRMYLPEARALRSGHVEVTGPEGGPVQMQQGVQLVDVLAVLVTAGAAPAADGAAAPQPALPAAPQVLAEPK